MPDVLVETRTPQKFFEDQSDAPKKRRASSGTRKKKPDPNAPTPDSDWQPGWKPRKRPVDKEARSILAARARSMFEPDFFLPDDVPLPVRGKPWDRRLFDAILDFVEAGGTIKAAAHALGFTDVGVRQAIVRAGLLPRLEEARRIAADALVEQALHYATDPQLSEETTTVDTGEKEVVTTRRFDNVYARKLAYEARMKIASKWAPDRYGDKLEVKTEVSTASAIAAARRRLSPDVVDVEPVEGE